jgi:DNA-binding CsgD family transcriptional regulator
MEHLSMDMEHQNQQEAQSIQWRRDKVLELTSQGHNQRDISTKLQIGIGTVNRDLAYIKQQSRLKIRKYIDETLPNEYEKCLVGITSILKEAWNTSQNAEINKREKIHALSLAKECYSMKLDLLTNATVVNDAMKLVSEHSSNKRLISNEENYQVSKELDYNEDSELEEEREKETEEIMTGETTTTTTTTNQVF